MSAIDTRHSNVQLRRLQLLLLLMIVWDLIAVVAGLSFGGPLAQVEDGEVGGVLAARVSFSGAALVPIVIYLYALVRNPLRHRGVLLAGVVEQGAAAAFAGYHFAADDIKLEAMAVALVAALALAVLLIAHMPRAQVQV